MLLDPPLPEGFDVCNTEIVPGLSNFACNLQVYVSVTIGLFTIHVPVFLWPSNHNYKDTELEFCMFS